MTEYAKKLWSAINSRERDLTKITDDELTMLWKNEDFGGMGALGRGLIVQSEMIRRNSIQNSKEAERLAKFALYISIVSTIGTLVQVWFAFFPQKSC